MYAMQHDHITPDREEATNTHSTREYRAFSADLYTTVGRAQNRSPPYSIYQTEDLPLWLKPSPPPAHQRANFSCCVAKIQGEKSQDIKVTHYLKAKRRAQLSQGSNNLPPHVLLLQQNKSLPALGISHYLRSGFS